MIHDLGNQAVFLGTAGGMTAITFACPIQFHQALKLLVNSVEKVVGHMRIVYVFIRYSSLGHTQYIPPGIPADLMTRVATIGVVHCGHGFPL
jgi:hypothetical protein